MYFLFCENGPISIFQLLKKQKEKLKYPEEKLKGTANHYALPIHIGVSKKHHVNIFQHLLLC
jgi:hypothetical protein